MSRTALRLATIAFLALLPSLACANTDRPSLRSACAAWDLHIVMLIEEIGTVEPTALRLADAARALSWARNACDADDAASAMRHYESIDLQPPARATQPVFGLF